MIIKPETIIKTASTISLEFEKAFQKYEESKSEIEDLHKRAMAFQSMVDKYYNYEQDK